MKVLELFSGHASFSNEALKFGHEIFTIDFKSKFNPSLCKDIINLQITDLPIKWQNPDIIWASIDCTYFTVANIGRSWSGGKEAYIPKTKEVKNALELVKHTLSLIEEINPKYAFIENPRGILRKLPIMQSYSHLLHTVCYCRYGDIRMKPTDIWTNLEWTPKPMCYNNCSDHEYAPRGSKTGTQGLNKNDRARIPKALCIELLDTIETIEIN